MQKWGITVADGPKFKQVIYNGNVVAYSRKLPNGCEESLIRPLDNMKPIHIFSNPKVKSENILLNFMKNCFNNLIKKA